MSFNTAGRAVQQKHTGSGQVTCPPMYRRNIPFHLMQALRGLLLTTQIKSVYDVLTPKTNNIIKFTTQS